MNNDLSSSRPVPSCPDQYGTLPSCANLAVSYVPFQQNEAKKYSQRDALSNGTLFPGLNLPFHLKVEGSQLPAGPLVELQALEFVMQELMLYLDTHPEDEEAAKLLEQFSAMECSAKAEYERRFGPLTMSSAVQGGKYRWLQEPWPWTYRENEVK